MPRSPINKKNWDEGELQGWGITDAFRKTLGAPQSRVLEAKNCIIEICYIMKERRAGGEGRQKRKSMEEEEEDGDKGTQHQCP